jgi:MazG family protein
MNKQTDKGDIEKLLQIMARLRAPGSGCPWDLEQTFATIAPYTIEEAYEVADAIERGALDELEDELGDLLFQVVFHARMAEEANVFDFVDVVAAICDKLVRRHPHVFGDERGRIASADDQTRRWDEIKREERHAGGATRVLADVPVALPGLARATKLGKRAATVGFDWPDAAGVRAKVTEELAELDAALAASAAVRAGAADTDAAGTDAAREAVAAEVGDLLFTIANLCRHLDLDPEACVRGANARFETRFAHIEQRVRAAGGDWSAHNPASLERLWQEAKNATR